MDTSNNTAQQADATNEHIKVKGSTVTNQPHRITNDLEVHPLSPHPSPRATTRPPTHSNNKQSAATTTEGAAPITIVDTHTPALSAVATTRDATVQRKPSSSQRTFKNFVPLPSGPTTPINISRFETLLEHHPDRKAVNFITHGLKNGFSVGCKITILPARPNNLQSANNHAALVTQAFQKELDRAHIAGPFEKPPIPNLHCSPIGARLKPDGAARLILDLSQPNNNAVSEGISKEDHSVQYSSFDDATNSIKDAGHHALLSKLDIANAFRIIPVKPEEWVLLGMYWEGHYFVDCHLPFGSRSSPFIFNVFADLLTWIIQSKFAPT